MRQMKTTIPSKEELLKISLYDFSVPQAVRSAAIKAQQEVCDHRFGGPAGQGGERHCCKCGFILTKEAIAAHTAMIEARH